MRLSYLRLIGGRLIMADEAEYITATRVLEYYGPKAYIEKLLKGGWVPPQGLKELPAGAYIRSGMIQWEPAVAAPPRQTPIIPMVPPSGGPA
jgi:hypothetical protein